MVQINNGLGAACDCITGTAYFDIQGNCRCSPNTNTTITMPSIPLPSGWVWRLVNGRYIPTRINNTVSVIQPQLNTGSVSNWITANKSLALAIGAGALYFLTKKK